MESKSASPSRRGSPQRPSETIENEDFSQHALSPNAHTLRYLGTHSVRLLYVYLPVISELNLRMLLVPQPPVSSRHCNRPLYQSIDSNRATDASAIIANKGQEDDTLTPCKASTNIGVAQRIPITLALEVNAEFPAKQSPQTPQRRLSCTSFDTSGLSATQRERIELSDHCGSQSLSGLSLEDVFATNLPLDSEKINGPRSCPTNFRKTGAHTRFAPSKRRHERIEDFRAFKLLPIRDRIDTMLTYMHELQVSEASLQKQLVTTKRHTEEELYQLMSKLNELRQTIKKVESERQTAQARLKEKEKRIGELAAKLKHIKATQTKSRSPARQRGTFRDILLPIAEEEEEAKRKGKKVSIEEQSWLQTEMKPVNLVMKTPALPVETLYTSQAATPSLRPTRFQLLTDECTQLAALSPRSPHRPLWDPWASGGATPMKNMPPVFTLGAAELHAEATAVATGSTQRVARNGEDDELRSVLMSPRYGSVEGTALQVEEQFKPSLLPPEQQDSDLAEAQCPATASIAGSLVSPFEQQQLQPSKAQCDNNGQQMKNEKFMAKCLSPSELMLRGQPMPTIYESRYEQPNRVLSPFGSCTDEVHRQTTWQNSSTLAVSFITTGLSIAPSTPLPAQLTTIPRQQAMNNKDTVKAAIPNCEKALKFENSKAAQVSKFKSDSPRARLHTLDHAALPPLKDSNAEPAEPVSLEVVLGEFFTKVDKKRLKMATIYSKRYTGREKWLFAALTKRYGAAKVAEMKARYDSSNHAPFTGNCGGVDDDKDNHASKLSNASSDHSNESRTSHIRHHQFVHSSHPASDSNVNAAGLPSVSDSFKSDNVPNNQPRQEAQEAGSSLSSSVEEFTDRASRASPQRRSVGNNSCVAGPSSSLLIPKKIYESNPTAEAGGDARSMINGPISARLDKPSSVLANQSGMQVYNVCQCQNDSKVSTQDQKNKPSTVALDDLLKESCGHNQPDKLENALIITEQYAGKEGLPTGKCGALSLQQLDKSLDVLEHAHIGGKKVRKKRSRSSRAISLMFWLSVLLFPVFGAVFVSFVALDAWKCHGFVNDQQESDFAKECIPFQKDLETFTYERVTDYMSASYSGACFCSEWNIRQSALVKNLLSGGIIELVKLVPFSPDLNGRPWMAGVKEQLSLQKLFDNYAKPVLDLSLIFGSFMWYSDFQLNETDDKNFRLANDVKNVVADILPGIASGSDRYALERAVDNEKIKKEEETGEQLTDETGAKSGETSVEEGLKMNGRIQIDNADVTKDETSEENALIDNRVAAKDKESVAFTVKDNKVYDKVGSVDVSELDTDSIAKKSKSVTTNKVELADMKMAATKIETAHDAVIISLEDSGYFDSDGDEAVIYHNNMQARKHIFGLQDVPEHAIMNIATLSLQKNAAELNNVGKTEVCQKSVGLPLYETNTCVSERILRAEYTEGIPFPLVETFKPFVVVGADGYRDERTELMVKHDTMSIDLVNEPELVPHAAEIITVRAGNDTDAKVEKAGPDFNTDLSYSLNKVDVARPPSIKSNVRTPTFGKPGSVSQDEEVILLDDLIPSESFEKKVSSKEHVTLTEPTEQVSEIGGSIEELLHHKGAQGSAFEYVSQSAIAYGVDMVTTESPSGLTSMEPNIVAETVAVEAIILEHGDRNVEDNEMDEEIAFMKELKNPGELLRMAEQAAVAELLTMEMEW